MFSIHYNADYNTRLKEIFKKIEESEDIVTIENAASIRKRMKHIAIPIMLLEILSIMAVRTILIQRVS
jgi:hypothetical protein